MKEECEANQGLGRVGHPPVTSQEGLATAHIGDLGSLVYDCWNHDLPDVFSLANRHDRAGEDEVI
jgi:hypothetical protein